MRRVFIGVGALIVVLLIVWLVVRARAAGAVVYRTATVERGNIEQTVSATGTISAVRTVTVGTRVSGLVTELHADFNDSVKKGELLALIDPTLQKEAIIDAQAQLGKAQAQADQAKAEYDRNLPLFTQKFISATDFATLQTNLSVAQAGLKSAQVALSEAQQNLAYTNIYAPITGVVVVRSVDVGQTVAASTSAPTLFQIAQDLKQVQILAAVDESDIAGVKDSQTVKFTVEAYPDTFTARVSQVRLQSQLTDNVVNYTVVITVDNPDGKLLPGMTATVEFITGSAMNVLVVPNLALRFKPSADEMPAATPRTPTTNPSDTTSGRAGVGAAADRGTGGRGAAGAQAGTAGQGGGAAAGRGGGAGTKRATAGSPGSIGTLYTLDAANKLKAIRVRLGLSDGQRTEVMSDSLTAGMQVVVGTATAAAAKAAAPSTNPLTPQRGAGGGRGGG